MKPYRSTPRRARLGLATALLLAVPAAGQSPAPGLSLLDAVTTTLSEQPDIRLLNRQVDIAAGDLEAQRGIFDTTLGSQFLRQRDETPLNSTQAVPDLFEALRNDTTRLGVSASQLFRFGLTLTPSVSFDKTTTNLPDALVENRYGLGLTATQPLLRGRGRKAAAVGEIAQGHELLAVRAELGHGVAQSVLRTVQAYWNYVATVRALAIVSDAEDRFGNMRDEAEALIQADQMPAADIKQLKANLASRTGSRLQAEQQVLEARHALGLAMGLPVEQFDALPVPADDFPAVAADLPQPAQADLFVPAALARRGDLQAATRRIEAAGALLESARNGIQPKLDLQLRVGYKGLAEGSGTGRYFAAFGEGLAGPDVAAAVTFQFPPSNRAAEGQLARSTAVMDQARTAAFDRERQVRSGVTVALADLATAGRRVAIAAETAALFREAVDDEQQKVRLGLGTVVDLIFTQDSLTSALIDEVQARFGYALALARLRYETGTLLAGESDRPQLDPAALTTAPAVPR
ncbi:MAG: TolC family protein [Vicinamibacteria bacterium]|nr:TolC family protein [Vicinamibacteria bacterium]